MVCDHVGFATHEKHEKEFRVEYLLDGSEGVRNMKLVEACYTSAAADGRFIDIG